jgi:hypothetical protein
LELFGTSCWSSSSSWWTTPSAFVEDRVDFDNHPRLETVVGFLFAHDAGHKRQNYEQND